MSYCLVIVDKLITLKKSVLAEQRKKMEEELAATQQERQHIITT